LEKKYRQFAIHLKDVVLSNCGHGKVTIDMRGARRIQDGHGIRNCDNTKNIDKMIIIFLKSNNISVNCGCILWIQIKDMNLDALIFADNCSHYLLSAIIEDEIMIEES
jgi:hypothetical protein